MHKITLQKEDFLRYQLFVASMSEHITKKRRRTWIILTASFLGLGLVMLQSTDRFLSYYFMGFSLVTLIFYPLYQRSQYRRHYEKHIAENYGNKIGIESMLGFEDGFLISKAANQEAKIRLTELQEITEIRENLFIKIKSGESLIVPVSIPTYEALKAQLYEISESLDIRWNKQLDWEWR